MNSRLDEVIEAFTLSAQEILKRGKMKEYAEWLAETIRVRTRLGYGVRAPRKEREKLKPLSAKYVQRRKTSPDLNRRIGSPARSGLTLTGTMLESLKGSSPSNGKMEITASGEHNDDDFSNAELAQWNTEKGRPFLNPSNLELKRLANMIKDELITKINQRLTKIRGGI